MTHIEVKFYETIKNKKTNGTKKLAYLLWTFVGNIFDLKI